MIQTHPCACGCGKMISIKDIRGRYRKWSKGHHHYRPIENRFWEKVKKTPAGCWLWMGSKEHFGHGHIGNKGKMLKAHRLAWEFENGKIPDGLHCLHKCDNPSCVNPSHLFLGTHQDNMRDMISKNRQSSKLTKKQVIKMRQYYMLRGRRGHGRWRHFKKPKGISFKELGKKFNVKKQAAWKAINHVTWNHVPTTPSL